MDFKIFFTVFTAVFVAELADKTQLVGIAMTASSGKPWTVYLGSVSAYIIATLLSVFIGVLAAKFLKPEIIRYVGAAAFIVIGVLMLLKKV